MGAVSCLPNQGAGPRCCAVSVADDDWTVQAGEEDANDVESENLPKRFNTRLHAESRRLPRQLHFGPRKPAPTYPVQDSKLVGSALMTNKILFLSQGQEIQEGMLSLYLNGFHVLVEDAEGASSTWSPFSVVEKCGMKNSEESDFAVFKLTVGLDSNEQTYYFGTCGEDASKRRETWVSEISSGIQVVTASLFPPHAMSVAPVSGNSATNLRIMAGYLLCLTGDVMILYYCELHAYNRGNALLAIYDDHLCDRLVKTLHLTDQTVVSSRKGCSAVFGVGNLRFGARSTQEKDLWLRAVGNIKVKLMFEAPDPTSHELAIFRTAVLDRINSLKEEHYQIDPLLPAVHRVPQPAMVVGDMCAVSLEHSAEASSP